MFRAPLCPSSRVQGHIYCIWFSAFDVLAGALGCQEAGRVHSVEAVIIVSRIRASTRYTRPASQHPKTPTRTLNAEKHMQYIRPCAPEDGHKGARSMLG